MGKNEESESFLVVYSVMIRIIVNNDNSKLHMISSGFCLILIL